MDPLPFEWPCVAAIVKKCLGTGFSSSASCVCDFCSLHALSEAARVNTCLYVGFSIHAPEPFRETFGGWIPREQAGIGKVAHESIRKPRICVVFLDVCFLCLGGSALLGAGFLTALPSSVAFLLEHSAYISLASGRRSPSSFVVDENCVCGEVPSIAIDCSLGVVTVLRSLGSVAPVGLLLLDDLNTSKCLCTSIMTCRLSTGLVKHKKNLTDNGP